jgi:AmmeMemoRadiSam system protein B
MIATPAARPRLRPEIDATQTDLDDRTAYVLYDPSGYSSAQLVLGPAALFVVSLCDGSMTVAQMQATLAEQTGEPAPAEALSHILETLEEALFLESPRFRAHRERVESAFAAETVRESTCAGSVYPAEPAALTAFLERSLRGAPEPETAPPPSAVLPAGVVAPHIDHLRGAPGYGQVYRLLARFPAPDTVVILGTAHRPAPGPFVLTRKAFRTPLGEVANDEEATAALAAALPGDAYAGEFAHGQESSVELQLPFLQHVWGEGVAVAPVLCAPLPEASGTEGDDAARRALAAALRRLLAERGPRLLLLASADLSHVGRHFGEPRPLDEALKAETEAVDREYLAACGRGEAAASRAVLEAHGNRTGICSAACLHTLLAALEPRPGLLLGYHQAVSPEMQQLVSYAALVYPRGS